MKDGRQEGYQVVAPGSSAILQQAGVQRGDVLLAVDGAPLTPEGMNALPQKLASAAEVELRFERAGQVMTKRVRVGGR
jgi:type II secretory pathway component PulC